MAVIPVRMLLNVAAGLAVVLASFWITLGMLTEEPVSADPEARRIEIAEATYGMSCQQSGAAPGDAVKAGNATAAISESCKEDYDEATGRCSFMIDVKRIGDPAPGCAKDFSVGWRCGKDPALHRRHIAAEANARSISLVCPAR
jgi:hypothetical protein